MSLYEITNILGRIERATIARQRYVLGHPGTIDQAVDHVLCSHVDMLTEIALGQTCTEGQIKQAMAQGAAIAAAEMAAQL